MRKRARTRMERCRCVTKGDELQKPNIHPPSLRTLPTHGS